MSAGLSQSGRDAATKVVFAVDRLKEKFPASLTFEELLGFTMSQADREKDKLIPLFKEYLRMNSKVSHKEGTNVYRFKPHLDIASAEDLITYLQQQTSAMGIDVRKLKEGWPECEEEIDQLERAQKLLVSRNKKDNHPRMVWANDASLYAPVGDEFKQIWLNTPLASKDEIIRSLQQMGHTPTGEIVKLDPVNKVTKKVKKVRRGAKVTNVHMQGMFRDYSDKRPQGK